MSVAPPGFEPRQTEPKSVVLPLYYGTKYKILNSQFVGFEPTTPGHQYA